MHVDSLSKRSKYVENSFLNAYKTLANIPDPAPLLLQIPTLTKQLADVQVLYDKAMEHMPLPDEDVQLKLQKREEELNQEFMQREILYKERFIKIINETDIL